jgi:alkanesulfonate monooxygenase
MTKRRYEDLLLFTTCPPSSTVERSSYLQTVVEVAQWSEAAGCTGILVYTDNALVTPWQVAQVIVLNTRRLAPLVAVQPVYMSPYWAAKEIASIAFVHGRMVWLNMLAGGFKNDLQALGDDTPHDERYTRTVEYTQVVQRWWPAARSRTRASTTSSTSSSSPRGARRPAAADPDLWLVDAGLAAAKAISAVAVQYPKPPGEHKENLTRSDVEYGIRIGVLARERSDDAWRIAEERFPPDGRAS